MLVIPNLARPLTAGQGVAQGAQRSGRWLLRAILNRSPAAGRPCAPPAFATACSTHVRQTIAALCAIQSTGPDAPLFARFAGAGADALGEADLRRLRDACRRRLDTAGAPAQGLGRIRLEALHDYSIAGRRQLRLARLQQEREQRLLPMAAPGAQRTTSAALQVGIGAGLPFAARASLDLGVGTRRTGMCFETLEYAEGCSVTCDATASAGLDAGIDQVAVHAGATAAISLEKAHYRGAASPRAFAHHQARLIATAPWYRRLWRRLTDAARPPHAYASLRADRHADALRTAMRWDPLLPALLGPAQEAAGQAPAAVDWQDPLEPLLEARLSSKTVQLAAHAGACQLAAAAAATRTWLEAELQVPVWLPDACLEPRERQALAASLGERILQWSDPAAAPAPMLATAMLHNPDEPGFAQHPLLVERLHAEWRNLQCLLVRRDEDSLRAPLRAALASVCADWRCRSAQDVLGRMLQLCHWLQLSAPHTAGPGLSAPPSPLAAQARALANEIIASPVMCHDRRWIRSLHATRQLRQRFRRDGATLEAAAELPGAAAIAGIAVARSDQRNYNALRDGQVVEVTLALRCATDPAVIAQLLHRLVPEAGPMPALDVPLPSGPVAAGLLQADAGVELAFRFFRPTFQEAPDFPEHARGYHLQQLRVTRAVQAATGGHLYVPAAPLVDAGVGLAWAHARSTPLQPDTFYSGTLTATLLRYQSLRGQGQDRQHAWRCMLQSHPDSLRRLDMALRRAGSSAAAEALHWLGAGTDDPMPPAWTAYLDQSAAPLAALCDLFEALLVPLAGAQRRSPLCSSLRLPTAATARSRATRRQGWLRQRAGP